MTRKFKEISEYIALISSVLYVHESETINRVKLFIQELKIKTDVLINVNINKLAAGNIFYVM